MNSLANTNTKLKINSLANTKLIMNRLEKGINLLAKIRIGANLSALDTEAECSRIERCIEYQYKLSREELNYLEFAFLFLIRNRVELLSGTRYNGMYIDDVKDVPYRKE